VKKKENRYGHSGAVNTVAAIKNSIFASGSADKTIRIWDMEGWNNTCIRVISSASRLEVTCIAVFIDKMHTRIVSCSETSELKFWNVDSGECDQSLPTKRIVSKVAVLSDGRVVGCYRQSTEVVMWV